MTQHIDYYALLGISSTATPNEITRAYRKRILEVHLDKRPQGEDSDLCYKTIEAHRILSNRNLRAKYDIERDPCFKAQEGFVPAGYICYDVGQSQMSKRILQNITDWKNEFDKINSTGNGYSDNYFECFSTLMNQVINGDGDGDESVSVDTLEQDSYYFCTVCDRKFLSDTHHWEDVLYPYVKMLTSDKCGVGALSNYFETILGSKLFNWEPRHLPKRLLGIWASEAWEELAKYDKIVSRILSLIPPEDDFPNVEQQIRFVHETFLSDSETDDELYPPVACKLLCWIMENQDDQDAVVDKMVELLMKDEVEEIMYVAAIMKNFLSCTESVWNALVSDAMEAEQPDLAMLWTKIGIEFGELGESRWYVLGMKLRGIDPVLAHFCFLSGEYELEAVAEAFERKRDHFASMEYHLIPGNIYRLFEKSRKLLSTEPEAASMYRNVHYSLRVKSILAKLKLRQRDDSNIYDNELEELIELIQELGGNNILDGFGILTSTWPKALSGEAVGYGVHRWAAHFLKQNRITIKSFNLILGAMHFLPWEEVDQEDLTTECVQLAVRQIEQSMRTSDFGCLTEILQYMNGRALPGALQVLQDMEEETQQALIKTSPHLKAMQFLIKGTVCKVHRDWMEAMKEFQNALLCSPECMHRVLPCISKLSQDIEFHEAVVGEVETEVRELKDIFDAAEYPEVEKYSSNRNSLVITDVAPKMDFGYKNAMGKIELDPVKLANLPPPSEEEPVDTPVNTNTPLITLDKNEEAIESCQEGPSSQLNAALSYIDLLKALPMPFQQGPIVMAASHFLRAMDHTKDTGDLFAYRNAILLMAENLLRIDQKTEATIQHCLTHKHMLSILLSAHEKLSKALRDAADSSDEEEEDEDEEDDDETDSSSSEDSQKSSKGIGIDIIKMSEANVISKFLKNVVNFPKIEPLANIPTLNCSDLVYVETLGNSFLSQFCAEKVGQKYQSAKIPKHLHAYTHFVEVWKGRSLLTDFGTARLKAMEELLALKGWYLHDVEALMGFPMLNLTDDGWTSENGTDLKFPNPTKAYQSIYGFKINYETAQISFLVRKEKQSVFSSGYLFDTRDLKEIFSNNIEIDQGSLRLDSPDVTCRSHPFKEAKFDLKEYRVPRYFQTLSRAAMLMCYLASGLEICAKAPFHMKRVEDGLFNRLDEHLQYLLRPVKVRKEEEYGDHKAFKNCLDIPHKFWLNMTEIFEEEEEEEDESILVYKVGEVVAQVKMNTLVMTLNGSKPRLAAEAEFARDFTRNFDEIGNSFPELLRLKELVKISLICTKLRRILKAKVTLLKQNGRSKEELFKIARVCSAIRELGISLDEETKNDVGDKCKNIKNINKDSSDCRWFPAMFCHNLEPETYEVSAGIRMTPEVTYGPVNVPTDCVFVLAKDLL